MDSAEDKRMQQLICDYARAKCAADPQSAGVYKTQLYDMRAGAPVVLVVAFGEQALALDAAIMKAAQRPEGLIEIADKFGKLGN